MDSSQVVVYSIELTRKGQPLGITIASSGERGDPIIISQLASNGLAERFVYQISNSVFSEITKKNSIKFFIGLGLYMLVIEF